MVSLTVFFAVLAVLSGFAFVYPYLIYPLVLKLLPNRPVEVIADRNATASLEVALLFCAYNEEAALPDKLENLRMIKSEMPRLQIYAYSDCSTDSTNALLTRASGLLTPVFGDERVGKVLGMQRLVEIAEADILVFSDANVMIEPGSLTRLIEYFSDPDIGAVAATLIYDDAVDGSASVTAHVGSLYWRLEEHIKQMESKTGSMMGADGAFFARRRIGYPIVPPHLVDDMIVSLGVLFKGMRCVSAPDVFGIENLVTSRAEEFRRKRRIACGSYSTYQFMRRDLRRLGIKDRFKFFSHKLLRWWGAFFLSGSVLFTIIALITAGSGLPAIIGIAVGILFFVLLGMRNAPLIAPLYEVVLAVLATGIGVAESLAGSRYQIWDPAKTR